jgi:hypothetical protein
MENHVLGLWSLMDRKSKSWLSVCLILNGWDKLVCSRLLELGEEELVEVYEAEMRTKDQEVQRKREYSNLQSRCKARGSEW